MAEAILRSKKVEGMEVRSAGVFAANGSEASAHAKSVLDANRIPHQHSSSLLTNETVDWAELILTMTASHKEAIKRAYPGAAVKLFTLKEFTGEAVDRDVVDPFGGNLAMYQETFYELDGLIDKALKKLGSL
ncbi:protein-tyrosine phosphatase [Neobacillus ginsengisoli]|uniref:Protein-tyrosine phosphatase n=2 Tax=Neobacillus ginsengisoli TaxID=904295 RepID=A0ABT9XZF3_9BACI|nr:protein-tyrosine phosphatase [Neobacillus ginsengisoli]